jgi:hypothetical protein
MVSGILFLFTGKLMCELQSIFLKDTLEAEKNCCNVTISVLADIVLFFSHLVKMQKHVRQKSISLNTAGLIMAFNK